MAELEQLQAELDEAYTLVGTLVQIDGLEEKLCPMMGPDWAEVDNAEEAVELNGMAGICMAYDEIEKKYMIQTFEGGWFALPTNYVKQHVSLDAEMGGFDALWPADDLTGDIFHGNLYNSLKEKGYSVVQMFTAPRSRKEAAEESKRPLHKFKKFYAEDESIKLGKNNTTRVIELQTPDEDVQDLEESENPNLDEFNRDMSYATTALSEVLRHSAIDIWGRTDTWLRLPYGSAPDSEPPRMDDPEDHKQFLMWMTNRNICIIYVIETEGGELRLFPRTDDDEPTAAIELEPNSDSPNTGPGVKIPLRRGLMVAFHNDKLDYSYQPEGESLAMQSWLMTEPKSMSIVELDRPPEPEKVALHVMSVMERFPAGCYGADKSFLMFLSGCDAEVDVPVERMDYEPYWEPDPDAILRGKAYINHGSFVTEEHAWGFDNEFWGYTFEEAGILGLSQRWVMETGYTTLYKAGYRKKELVNMRLGTSIGDYVTEWDLVNPAHQYSVVDDRFSWTCQVLAYHLGFRGPSIHADTACSASMVALNAMCNLMRRGEYGTQEQLRTAICMGVLTMLVPFPWIGECAGTMLSYKGRCFTFDQSADGFIRGEGCCATNIQVGEPWEESKFDEKGRLAVVRGTASNQDGRSASLTAPSGPSQQACIRTSLRAANMDPREVWIGECHGTGTALGDPIEVGANKAVFGVPGRGDLNHILVSAKAHIGHTESTAGVCGFIKSLLMLIHGCTTADPHIKCLNSHLDTNGYPVLMTNEATDSGRSSTHGGVSSFGFGGSNTRGDLWARVMKGPRSKGRETVLDAREAFAFATCALTDGTLPTAKAPKLKAAF